MVKRRTRRSHQTHARTSPQFVDEPGGSRDGKTQVQLDGEQGPLAFARHETFHPRFGWIKKGFDVAQNNPLVFQQEDAPAVLGVGKNMVRAIRYWCSAFKVLSDSGRSVSSPGSKVTDFGRFLLSDDGFDPYLEYPGSLWLLHWKLLQQPCTASAWRFAFSIFARPEFSVDDLTEALREWVAKEAPDSHIAVASLRKDVQCIVRMYAETQEAREVNEDSIDCPFAELGLIRPLAGQKRSYAFNLGAKPGLSSELVAATCLDFASRQSRTARSVSFSRLLRAPMSPGMSFKLTESALYDYLEEVAESDRRLQLSDTAGLVQLSFADDPSKLHQLLLKRHFKSNASRRVSA
jgi:hypothetical protein